MVNAAVTHSLENLFHTRHLQLTLISMTFRASGMRRSRELGPVDLSAMDFLYELGKFDAQGCSPARLARYVCRPPPRRAGIERFTRRVQADCLRRPLCERAGGCWSFR